MPAAWRQGAERDETAKSQTLSEDSTWPETIIHPPLRSLITVALENNRDLRQAVLNIEASRALYGIERAARLPTINAGIGLKRERIAPEFLPPGLPGTQSGYRAALGLADFEIDLFGRMRDLSRAAHAEFLASAAAAQMVQISLIAEVSRTYVELIAGKKSLTLLTELAASQQRSAALAQAQLAAGIVSLSEYEEIRALSFRIAAEAANAEGMVARAEHALQRLTATDSLPASGDDHLVLFAPIRPGLPSTLLERRPDILAAEHRLRGRHASIGAARAAFFPRISLTAETGGGSLSLSRLFSSASRTWEFSPRIVLPIFTAGANLSNLKLAEVRRDMAVADYESTIQKAFAEVADALSARQTSQRQSRAQANAVQSVAAAATRIDAQYRAGITEYTTYLDVERRLMRDRLVLIQNERDLALAEVDLYRSLGGGWL